jgi:hypothetical protein
MGFLWVAAGSGATISTSISTQGSVRGHVAVHESQFVYMARRTWRRIFGTRDVFLCRLPIEVLKQTVLVRITYKGAVLFAGTHPGLGSTLRCARR